jgi:hypothetical protein
MVIVNQIAHSPMPWASWSAGSVHKRLVLRRDYENDTDWMKNNHLIMLQFGPYLEAR